MKEIIWDHKSKEARSLTLKFCSNDKASKCHYQINEISSSTSKLKSAEFTFFIDYTSLKTRSIIVFALDLMFAKVGVVALDRPK